jgi:hypothetical protein
MFSGLVRETHITYTFWSSGPTNRKLLLLAFTVSILSAGVSAQTKQPKTVRDFFMALPDKYFSLDCCMSMPRSKRKAEYLKQYLSVEDAPNGYMKAFGDAAQEGFAMALFKRPNGTYLIGFYTVGEGGVEDTPWTVFLNYKNGRFTDVSRHLIAGYSKEKYIYELPRNGTTIEVFEKDENGQDWYKGKKLYDLAWKDGRFVKK